MSEKSIAPYVRIREFDANGNPLAGGKLYTYRTGTSTPKSTYSDGAGTLNANPIVLDSEGSADVWLDDDEPYRFRLETSTGSLRWQRDGVTNASGTIVRSVENIAALKLIGGSSTATTIINVAGYYDAGDNGGGSFWWDSASTATDDGGSVIKATAITTGRWKRIITGDSVSLRAFGAIGDGSADDTDEFNACSLYCYTTGLSMHIPSGTYELKNTGYLYSKVTYVGDGDKSRIQQTTVNAPVLASIDYISTAGGPSPTGRCNIRDLLIYGSTSVGSGNHGILLRDYYSNIENVRIYSTGGDGIRITDEDNAGSAVSGTLVENRIERCSVYGAAGHCYYLGDDNNNKITDGWLIDCIASTSATSPRHLFIGSAAGWTVNGLHTYGTAPTDESIEIRNSYHTNVDNVYVECYASGGTANAIGFYATQRALAVSNVTVKAEVASTAAISIGRSGSLSPYVTISGLTVVNSSAAAVTGVETNSATITVQMGPATFANTGAGSITKYSGSGIRYVDDAVVSGPIRETTNDIALMYNGLAIPAFYHRRLEASNPAVAVSESFTIPEINNYRSVAGIVNITLRANYNGTQRAVYVGMFHVQAKDNASDAWVASLTTIVTPSGFGSNPAISVSNTGSAGQFTITYTPTNTDGFGAMTVLMANSESA